MATIDINGPGHGAGALGTADVNLTSGETVTISAGGRGVDADGNNTIGANEGFITVGAPYALIGYRDVIRQTVANLMQLVRVIQTGMDVDSDGTADLDPARITFLRSSLGATMAFRSRRWKGPFGQAPWRSPVIPAPTFGGSAIPVSSRAACCRREFRRCATLPVSPALPG